MNAIGYIRVSTEDQAHNGVSLEMQTTKIKQYCELHNMDLCGIYGDPGISAKNTENRPGVNAVLQMVDKKRIDAMVIYKLDRICRNTISALEIAQRLKKNKVGFHSITEELNTSSATGKFFFTFMASLAEMEREQIGERTSAALQMKKAKGERVSRYAPIGMRLVGDVVIPDVTEQAAIKAALHLKREGLSLGNIASCLYTSGYKSRTGRPYSKSTIAKMIGGDL